jgi:uncharacterized protein (TIGR01777 family)
VIAGGSGFLGRSLAAAAAGRGYEVVVLSRREVGTDRSGVRVVAWDGCRAGGWEAELEGAAAVVNLAGRNVNCRYRPEVLAEIDRSRVDSVRAIGDAIHRCRRPPGVWVQAGTLAIYGDAGDRWCDEGAPAGRGVPVRTALKWEEAFAQSPTPLTRRVLLRIGFVLGRGGGALPLMTRLVRSYLGGAVGGGGQFVSWIHEADLNRVILRAIEDDSFEGTFNATSPEPVTNREFMAGLRRALGRPWSPPVPAWAVRLGCLVLGTEPVLALTGRRGDPRRLEEAGFTFRFPSLRAALADLFFGETAAGLARGRTRTGTSPIRGWGDSGGLCGDAQTKERSRGALTLSPGRAQATPSGRAPTA